MTYPLGNRVKAIEAQKIERNGSHNRKIDSGMTITSGRVIFLKYHIFNPMEAIFNLQRENELVVQNQPHQLPKN